MMSDFSKIFAAILLLLNHAVSDTFIFRPIYE